MKTLLIITLLIIGMTGITSALEVGECTIIESGLLAGRTVCFLGTITVEAGETTEVDFTINETIQELETTETLETNNGKHFGWYKNGKL